jgi:hypothetical protein
MTDLIELAKQAGAHHYPTADKTDAFTIFMGSALQAFADLVRQHEMERCIEIAKRNYNGENIAKAIRARTA